MAVSYMTEEGYNKILAEINYLETVKRPEISAQIAEARDKGDLSENAEYDAAKEAQGIMEAKLAQLKGLIANARLIDESRIQTDEVQILNKVKIKNTKNNAVMTYTLVSDSEANLREGKIAVSTPIAQGLMGKKVGDVVDILAVNMIGAIPDDESIVVSANQGEPLAGTQSLAGQAYMNICRRIVGENVPLMNLEASRSFLSRLSGLLKRA